jgi:hypothetical protein
LLLHFVYLYFITFLYLPYYRLQSLYLSHYSISRSSKQTVPVGSLGTSIPVFHSPVSCTIYLSPTLKYWSSASDREAEHQTD